MANIAPIAISVVNHTACIQALRDAMAKLAPTLFVTLAFNQAITLPKALEALDHLHACIDSAVLGHNWQKRGERRTRFIAVVENVSTNLHLHLLLKPADGKAWEVSKRTQSIWQSYVPAGSVDIQPVTDLAGIVSYMLKQITLDTTSHVQFSKG
jgi:hypothetical protein